MQAPFDFLPDGLKAKQPVGNSDSCDAPDNQSREPVGRGWWDRFPALSREPGWRASQGAGSRAIVLCPYCRDLMTISYADKWLNSAFVFRPGGAIS